MNSYSNAPHHGAPNDVVHARRQAGVVEERKVWPEPHVRECGCLTAVCLRGSTLSLQVRLAHTVS